MSPTAALRYCAEPGCPARVVRGRCTQHRTDQERYRLNIDVRRWYRTARWRTLRAQLFDANPLCVECEKAGVTRIWTDLDHVVPHRGNPDLFWNPKNLQGLCAPHHTMKTGRHE